MLVSKLSPQIFTLVLLSVLTIHCVKKQKDSASNPAPTVAGVPVTPADRSGGIIANSAATRPSPDDLEKFRLAVVDKEWKICFITTEMSTQIDLILRSNRSWKTTSRSYGSKNCEGKVLSTEGEEGNYSIESPRIAGQFPINLTRTKSTPFYEIATLRGDKLYFGKTNDSLDGSTPEKRPSEIDSSSYYMATAKPPILKLDFHN